VLGAPYPSLREGPQTLRAGYALKVSYLDTEWAWHSTCSSSAGWPTTPAEEVTQMVWTTPEFVEVKMDAEINSYQDDFAGI